MDDLYMSSDYSDVTLIVEETRIPAHKIVLFTRSSYFRTLFFGGFAETEQNEITLKVPLEAFKAILKYIYTGKISFDNLEIEQIIDILALADIYEFKEAISPILADRLTLENCCSFLDAAQMHSWEKLAAACLTFADQNSSELLQHESFNKLSEASLGSLLQRDSFFAPEVNIYIAVNKWIINNSDCDAEKALALVRWPLISIDELLELTRTSGAVDMKQIFDATERKLKSTDATHRVVTCIDKNIALADYGARALNDASQDMLDGTVTRYDGNRGFSAHSMPNSSLIVQLGSTYVINYIKMLLWDQNWRSYSYYVEVSLDQVQWERIIDYRAYYCRSWQYLHFAPRAARFIRLTGTRNTDNQYFCVVMLEAMYKTIQPQLVNDIIKPTFNVAKIELGAKVVRGDRVILNGDFNRYDIHSGFASHGVSRNTANHPGNNESGDSDTDHEEGPDDYDRHLHHHRLHNANPTNNFLIQLNQPYVIDSFRMLLMDRDSRAFSFFIETSVDDTNWEIVVDQRDKRLKSWQQFTFEPRPVAFIRITGTHCTHGDRFQVVHFECPAQQSFI